MSSSISTPPRGAPRRVLDPERQRIANLRRRLAMLRRHAAARLPDGRSAIAVAGGIAAGRLNVERFGDPRAWGLALALRRHYGIPIPDDVRAAGAGGGRDGGV